MKNSKFIGMLVLLLIPLINRPAYQKSIEAKKQQKQESDDKLQPKRRSEIISLINDARLAAPEFAADVLIRIAESSQVKEQVWKVELLEEAFQVASHAKYSMKRTALPESLVDTRSGYLSNAFRLNLDRLSLQCRVVKAMLLINKAKAKELFAEIPAPKLEPLHCEVSLIYDVSDFYDTLGKVAQTAFTPMQMRQDEHIRFVERYINAISSPVQVEPAAKIVLSLKTSVFQLETLTHALSLALNKISCDDRSFSAPWVASIASIASLAQTCKERGAANDELLQSVRSYLVKQFNTNRCADTFTKTQQKSVESELVAFFNDNLRFARSWSRKEVPPLSADDIKPIRIEGTATYDPYWQSSKAKSLLSKFRSLRFTTGGKQFTDAEKQESEWRYRLSQFMNDLATWNPDDEKSEEDYFHQKNILFYGLLEVTPAGRIHDEVFYKFISFLSDSKLQHTNPIEWFLHANYIIKKLRSTTGEEQANIMDMMGHSSSAALFLYGEIEKLLPELKAQGR